MPQARVIYPCYQFMFLIVYGDWLPPLCPFACGDLSGSGLSSYLGDLVRLLFLIGDLLSRLGLERERERL